MVGWGRAPALRPRGPAPERRDERALVDLAIAQDALPVEQIELPIEPLFGLELVRALPGPPRLQQVELGRMTHGVIVPQRVGRPNREDPGQNRPRGCGAMQVHRALRQPAKPAIEAGQLPR